MEPYQLEYLSAMGIQPWQLKQPNSSPRPEVTSDLSTLCATVASCTACTLHKTRTQTVFGVGNQQANLMLIGEAPGFYEDQKGEPFVGRAGHLLNAMLQAIGLDRRTVYIANILKCRPPNNRDPLPEEVKECTGYLTQQIKLIQPKLLLALGRIAAHHLLNTQATLGQMRGKLHTINTFGIPLLVTYHPAYLLRNPQDKSKAWADLQQVYRAIKSFEQKEITQQVS